MVKARGICNRVQSKALRCCLLKCCPRNKNGIDASNAVNKGRSVPQAPTPNVNSRHISRNNRIGLHSSKLLSSSSREVMPVSVCPSILATALSCCFLFVKMTGISRHEYQKPSSRGMAMVRILVTGFEPFGEHSENISNAIVY